MPVVFLMGTTAAGKTDVAVELASQYDFDIVSVDAAQVYRGMNIGTAKPDQETLNSVPHRLVDICDPSERYSAGKFRRDALQEIDRSFSCGRIPLLVGGTMFYFRALEEGLSDLPGTFSEIGMSIQARAASEGWPKLHAELKVVDPESAKRISPNDAQRIQRLLELYYSAGAPPSQQMRRSRRIPIPYKILKIAITVSSRELLKSRIENRFNQMLESGFVDEARSLFERPDLDASTPSMKTVGYQQAWQYFEGKIDFQTMIKSTIQATNALAKRQLTWIRNSKGVVWVNNDSAESTGLLKQYLDQVIFP